MKQHDMTKKLARLGWTLKMTRGGHVKAIPPDNGPFVILSATPSDRRSVQNTLCILRRYGYDLRKELA